MVTEWWYVAVAVGVGRLVMERDVVAGLVVSIVLVVLAPGPDSGEVPRG